MPTKLTAADIAKLSDADLDLMLQTARERAAKIEELTRLGIVKISTPPKSESQGYNLANTPQPKPAPKSRSASVAKPLDPKWVGKTKFCPHCEETKDIVKEFGLVDRRGIVGPAGWCKNCRSTTNYRARDRKYAK